MVLPNNDHVHSAIVTITQLQKVEETVVAAEGEATAEAAPAEEAAAE